VGRSVARCGFSERDAEEGGLNSVPPNRAGAAMNRQTAVLNVMQMGEADRLAVAAAVARLQPQRLQLGLQVAHGQVPAPLACAAPSPAAFTSATKRIHRM